MPAGPETDLFPGKEYPANMRASASSTLAKGLRQYPPAMKSYVLKDREPGAIYEFIPARKASPAVPLRKAAFDSGTDTSIPEELPPVIRAPLPSVELSPRKNR